MKRKLWCNGWLVGGLGVALLLAAAAGCRTRKPAEVVAAIQKAGDGGKKGVDWLEKQQLKDGTFATSDIVKVGLTSLAVVALMDQSVKPDDVNIKRAVEFLAGQQQADGSIRLQEGIENYETALSMIALQKTKNKAYNDALKKAHEYLQQLQVGATGKIDQANPFFGGVGYGRRGNPDLSNTQFALEALKQTELGADAETFKRATLFIERCQNLQKVNKQPWASNDGGFVYMPGLSLANLGNAKDEPPHSYGSMSYAGLLSFAYCDVPKSDPRVQAALDWLRTHYTLDENPGMGQSGLFYYYMVMAKALSAYGERYLVDAKGVKHEWAVELVDKLIELQKPEGYWVNSNNRWMEDNKALVTAYCMITLNRCRAFLEK